MSLNKLTAEFAKKPLEFLRIHSIEPPAASPELRRTRKINVDEVSLRFFSDRGAIQKDWKTVQQRFQSGEPVTPIGWIRLREHGMTPGVVTFDVDFAAAHPTPRDYTDVSPDFGNRIEEGDRLPVFYLPWQPDWAVRLSIPQYRIESTVKLKSQVTNVEVTIDPYCPHIFFTAALSGCSVFVYGDPRRPTVAHLGTSQGTPYGDDSARFWRELLLLERFQRIHHGGHAREVNAEDYMTDLKNTASMEAFSKWLETQPPEFTIEEKIGWGAVFGIRYGSLWTFYLQENVTVLRHQVVQRTKKVERVKPGIWGLSFFAKRIVENVTVAEKQTKDTAIPMSVRPFFPNATGTARFWQTFEKSYHG